MDKRTRSAAAGWLLLTAAAGCAATAGPVGEPPVSLDLDALMVGLSTPARADYRGDGDGGLAHIRYWTIKVGSPEFLALPAVEQGKLKKIQAAVLHSAQLQPTVLIAGTEITGTLTVGVGSASRRQELVLKLPTAWNGSLVVAGAPGTRTEFANEATLVPWLLHRGYAYVGGNKGLTNGGADGNGSLLTQQHLTQHWGLMMHDLAGWATARLQAATQQAPRRVYAVGLSNGGYQVRRALEIDHQQVKAGQPRRFDGGLSWAGVYWPDARQLDKNRDGTVSPAEWQSASQLVAAMESAATTLGWPYDPAALTTAQAYAQTPPFSAAQATMQQAGFTAQSAILWGAYDQLFDGLKAQLPQWKGVGYYNLTGYLYRADLLGDDATAAAAYAMWAPSGGGKPPFYDWPGRKVDGGWTESSVSWALRNANSGEFSAPLISIHGDRDALIGLRAGGQDYDAAVAAYGTPALHRLYVIENGNHVDAHADGGLDYDCNGKAGDESAADLLTPMQPYAERAFDYLVDWVEHSRPPIASKVVRTDPKHDQPDAAQLTF